MMGAALWVEDPWRWAVPVGSRTAAQLIPRHRIQLIITLERVAGSEEDSPSVQELAIPGGIQPLNGKTHAGWMDGCLIDRIDRIDHF